MGIVAKSKKTNQIYFYLKGADSVIMDKVSVEEKLWIEEEACNLSKEGLRTLVFCYKVLSEK